MPKTTPPNRKDVAKTDGSKKKVKNVLMTKDDVAKFVALLMKNEDLND